MSARQLEPERHERIEALCAQGDDLVEAEEHGRAIVLYEQALALLPTPADAWEAATWIHAAIGDAYFLQGAYAAARRAFAMAMQAPARSGTRGCTCAWARRASSSASSTRPLTTWLALPSAPAGRSSRTTTRATESS